MTQRVLVTAGASGIGVAIAQAFVADGAKVHIGDIDADAVAEAVRGRDNMSGSVTDVSDADRVLRGRMEATSQSMEEGTQQALTNQSVCCSSPAPTAEPSAAR